MPPRLNAAQRRQAAADALELTDEERQQIVQARIDNEARDAEARRVLEAELARERHQAEQARAERITDAQVAALNRGVLAPGVAAGVVVPVAAPPVVAEQEGELPIEHNAAYTLFPGIPRDLIKKIYFGGFIPANLYKLRHSYGIDDADTSKVITFEGGRVVETAVKGKLKDYGTTSAIWSEAFLNYTAILTYFFGREVPLLNTRLLAFHNEVIELAGVYQWQEAALRLALDYHTHLADNTKIRVAESWELPRPLVPRLAATVQLSGRSSRPLNQLVQRDPPTPLRLRTPTVRRCFARRSIQRAVTSGRTVSVTRLRDLWRGAQQDNL